MNTKDYVLSRFPNAKEIRSNTYQMSNTCVWTYESWIDDGIWKAQDAGPIIVDIINEEIRLENEQNISN